MSIQAKSKEELIRELQELTKKYDSLKDSIEERVHRETKLEQTLTTSSDAMLNLTNSLTDVIISVKMPERVVEWCNNSVRSIGFEPDEITGQTTAFLFPDKESYLEFGERLEKSIEQGCTVFKTEQLFKKKMGELFSADVRVTSDLQKGKIVRATSIIRDITEQKQSEKALKESEEKYRQLYESNQMPISIFETKTLKFLSVNNAFVKKYGYSEEEFLNMTILDIRPKTEVEKLTQSVSESDDGLTNAGVFIHRKKNGEMIFVEIIRYSLLFEGKNAKMVFVNDITERKQAVEELKRHKENLEELVVARTKELEDKYAELERMNKLFVGRELRMVELKEKIRKLENRE